MLKTDEGQSQEVGKDKADQLKDENKGHDRQEAHQTIGQHQTVGIADQKTHKRKENDCNPDGMKIIDIIDQPQKQKEKDRIISGQIHRYKNHIDKNHMTDQVPAQRQKSS